MLNTLLKYLNLSYNHGIFSKIILLLLLGSSVCSTQAQVNAEQVMTIGRNVLSMEDYLLAIQYFNQAIKGKPYLADPYYYRGIAKLSLDDYEGAINDETLALERNKFKSEAYKVRGFALQNIGKDSLALIDYDKGLEYNPTDRYFLFYKAVAETSLKRFDKADSTFSVLLKGNPRFEDAWCARARLNLLKGDTVASLSDIDKTLSLSKSVTNAYLLRAQINADRKNWTDALSDINDAIRLNPDQTDLYVNRAFLRYNNEDFFGAMADYNYALEIDPLNSAALFNRGLLRFEVKELDNAVGDFSKVLQLEPDNFFSRYNRGLVRLELGDYREAISDFNIIAGKYPSFYPVYYAIAECSRNLGDMQAVGRNVRKAESLVKNYVADPDRHPLDRPKIAAGKYRDANADNVSEDEVMERFNQLVTTSSPSQTQLSFNDKIKGRVQDRSLAISPEPLFVLTFNSPELSLQNRSNYYRELDDINLRRYLSNKIYLISADPSPRDENTIAETFALEHQLNDIISGSNPRPVDFLARGIVRSMLKNYDGAESDLSTAIDMTDSFISAFISRSFIRMMKGDRSAAIADIDAVLEINPDLAYAWFNKGWILYNGNDFTAAIQAYSNAIESDPSLGPAYYNRGLAYLSAGNRPAAFSDLSKAGELGVLPSYSVLKRMK